MREKERNPEHGRRDWIIILILLLLGFLCMILAGERALRFSPIWRLNANMDSFIDPDSDFLTNRPEQLIEPLDQSILTNAVWVDLYQTPGAIFPTSIDSTFQTPSPTAQTSLTPTPVVIPSITNTDVPTATPTNTLIYFPPPPSTNTPRPPLPDTPTPTFTNTPLPSADLAITKTDGNPSYVAGGTVTYTIAVVNNGPSAVTGAVVSDIFDTTRLNNITWACAYTGGATSPCAGSGNINDTLNLPNSATAIYTVSADISGSATGNLVNNASVSVPAGYTDPVPGNNFAIDTNTLTTLSADLVITKTDGSATYTPGSSLTYTIVVINTGPTAVTGAVITDNKPGQISSWSWACMAQTGGASGCDAVTNSTANFSDTVNLPNGASITYTVSANTNAGATGNLVNTATASAPAGVYDPDTTDNSATDTDTPALSADLSITVTDKSTSYEAGAVKLLPNTPPYAYTITVSNVGPSNVTGATVSNTFSNGNIDTTFIGWGWICVPSAGASCSAAAGLGNLNNQSINLNSGASVTFYLAMRIIAAPSGDLVNNVTVTVPAGVTDPNSTNNSAIDTDQLVTANSFPYGNIGSSPDGSITNIPAGTYVTLQFGTPLIANGDSGWDLVYYELMQGPGIMMDVVILWIGDGSNWYTVLNWGDGNPDVNTNIPIPLASPPNPTTCASEPDNCSINSSFLYTSGIYSTGVAINVDAVIPPSAYGNFYYIRIFSPSAPTDTDGWVEVDAIEILP